MNGTGFKKNTVRWPNWIGGERDLSFNLIYPINLIKSRLYWWNINKTHSKTKDQTHGIQLNSAKMQVLMDFMNSWTVINGNYCSSLLGTVLINLIYHSWAVINAIFKPNTITVQSHPVPFCPINFLLNGNLALAWLELSNCDWWQPIYLIQSC